MERINRSELVANIGQQLALVPKTVEPWMKPAPVRVRIAQTPQKPSLLQFDRSPVVLVLRSLRGT